MQRVIVGELGVLAVKETDVDSVEVLPSWKVVRLHEGIDCLERWDQGFLNETERQVGTDFESQHHRWVFPAAAKDSKGLIEENVVVGNGTWADLGTVVGEELDLGINARGGSEDRAKICNHWNRRKVGPAVHGDLNLNGTRFWVG